MIVENYIESWDSEQHCMVENWINYQNLWYIFQIQCTQPHLETLSLGWLFSLQLLCPASVLAIASHWYSVPQILKAHSSLHSTFALKVILEELFYTVVSNIPLHHYYLPCMCTCVYVCAKSLQEFRWKKEFSHHLHVPST